MNNQTTPEQIFIEYCDINFGKAGTPDSTGRTFTQFERFATYWEIFKVAYDEGLKENICAGYNKGFEEGFKVGYRKGERDTDAEMQKEIRAAYFEGKEEGYTTGRSDSYEGGF
jgi:flagellar biosynthesis/type III secretory pathway protein FliH